MVVALGCDTTPSSRDASTEALPDAGQVMSPTLPTAPSLAPCPDGWVAQESDGVTRCDAWSSTRTSCPTGTAWFVGSSACEPVGPACPPSGEFAPIDPGSGRAWYVRPGATGDGSAAAPFGTIAEALGHAADGDTLALATGNYPELIQIDRPMRVVGACVTTRFAGPAGFTGPARIVVSAQGVELRNLTISGQRLGLYVRATGSADIENVVVEQAIQGGITVLGELTGRNVVVRDTQPAASGQFGRGIHLEPAASLTLARAVITGNREVGMIAGGANTRVNLTDVVIESTAEELATGLHGMGLVLFEGAQATAERVVIQDNRAFGLSVDHAGSAFMGTHVIVRRTASTARDGIGGLGIAARNDAQAVISRAWIHENHSAAMNASDGGRIEIDDAVVEGTLPSNASGIGGYGASIIQGELRARRVVFSGNHTSGIAVSGAESDVELEDVSVDRSMPVLSVAGYGVTVDLDATLRAERLRIEENFGVGLLAGERSSVSVSDLHVSHTASRTEGGRFGRGVEAQLGASLELTRAHIDSNRDTGLLVTGSGTGVTVDHLAVHHTQAAACGASTCPNMGGGYGVSVTEGTLTVRDFVLDASMLCGVQVGANGSLAMERGTIANHPIGLNLQNPDVVLENALIDVELIGNERNVDATTLPVPSAIERLPEG